MFMIYNYYITINTFLQAIRVEEYINSRKMRKRDKLKNNISALFQWVFFLLLKMVLNPFVFIFRRVRFKRNGIKIPKEPCIFMSNHQSNWDAIYMELMFFNRVIHVLAHDELFQNKLFAFIAGNILGCVKRGESKNDLSAIKKLVNLKKRGKNIGIYPEGDIDPFGRLLPVDDGIAKLTQKLNMPVVLLRINGAYLRNPRWGKRLRRSKVTYSIVRVITPEEARSMSVGELHEAILDGINYDEMKYVKEENVKVRRVTRRANYLERCLFYCPQCHALHSLKTTNNQIKCTNCGFSAKLNSRYFFKSDYDSCPVDPSNWDDIQRRLLPDILARIPKDKPIATLDKARLYVTARNMFFNGKHDNGVAKLFFDRIEYKKPRRIPDRDTL